MNTKETAEHLSRLLDATITVRQVVAWIHSGSLVAQNLNVTGERPIYNITKPECERFKMSRELVRTRPALRQGRSTCLLDPWVTC